MPATRSERDHRAKPTPCPQCGTVLSRPQDLSRHMKTHNKLAEAIKCPFPDCGFSAVQKSNLKTHMKTHTRVKDLACNDDSKNCTYCTTDPSALLRHRIRLHGYVPKRSAPKRKAKSATPKSIKDEFHIPCKTSPSATPEHLWPSLEFALSPQLSVPPTPELVAPTPAILECENRSLSCGTQLDLVFKASDDLCQLFPIPENLNWDLFTFPNQIPVNLLSTLTREEIKDLDALVNYPGVPKYSGPDSSQYIQQQLPSEYSYDGCYNSSAIPTLEQIYQF